MKLTEYEDKHAVQRVLITGLSKSGKSTLAASLSKRYRLIWIDTENAIEALQKLPPEQKANIELIKIPDSASFPMAAQTLQRLFKDKKADICFTHGTINCFICKKNGGIIQHVDLTNLDPARDVVVLDTLTQAGRSLFAHLMKTATAALSADAAIEYKPVLDDWGALRKNTEYLGSNIQSFPFNFVAITLAIETELEDGKVTLVPEFGSKGSSAGIASKFSTVIFCKTENKKHKAYSSSTASNLFLSGARSDFEIEKQADSMDLCPLFDKLVARSSREEKDKIPNLIPEIKDLPISRESINLIETKPQETKSSLLNLRNKLNLKKT